MVQHDWTTLPTCYDPTCWRRRAASSPAVTRRDMLAWLDKVVPPPFSERRCFGAGQHGCVLRNACFDSHKHAWRAYVAPHVQAAAHSKHVRLSETHYAELFNVLGGLPPPAAVVIGGGGAPPRGTGGS